MNDYVDRKKVQNQLDCWFKTGEYKYSNATHYLNKRISSIKSKSEWVSITHRLPEKHGWYLVAHKKTYPTDSGMKVRFFSHGHFVADMIKVTHWRPLPEYPESEDAE